MLKAGLKEPPGNATKEAVSFAGDFVPPDNDDLAVERPKGTGKRRQRQKQKTRCYFHPDDGDPALQ